MAQYKPSHHIPERFLRQLWKHQHFATAQLRTTDERSVEVVSPGKLNRDGGPDFRDAQIRIGGILYRGDVELHQTYEEWTEHTHQEDPKYNSVILHVVLRGKVGEASPTTRSKRTIPVLALDQYLTAPFRSTWESMILSERAERLSTIKCFSLNDDVEAALIQRWLKKVAIERIELKVRRFEERLKELVEEQRLTVKEPPARYDEIPFGLNPEDLPPPTPTYTQHDFSKRQLWEQLLYEGIMEALGYSKNQHPFLKLARNLRLQFLSDTVTATEDKTSHYEAIFFGVAGLPPSGNLLHSDGKQYAAQLKKVWKTYRQYYRAEVLNEAEWQFFRLRPENFPTVRLAGAARLIDKLLQKNSFKSIIQTVKDQNKKNREKFQTLESYFIISADRFWATHYNFGEQAKIKLTTLIGKARAHDIIVNVIIPICFLYARIFKDKEVRQGTLKIFEQCPSLSDNVVTRTIDKQLIKGKFKFESAILQQGALQLYKFYCVEERCSECAVGRVVFSV
ncbi:MAG: DUF2851 family protein [Ignavibacteriae bacterium]|nr:DUF2851 family protein [Ignavibacteriota bacterium]